MAVTRKNSGELEEGKKLRILSAPLINTVLPLNLHGLMISYLHILLRKISAVQCRWKAEDHTYEVQSANLTSTEVSVLLGAGSQLTPTYTGASRGLETFCQVNDRP